MICTVCGHDAAEEMTRVRQIAYKGHELQIAGDIVTKCASCNSEYYTAAQGKVADRRLVDARRRAERLMTGDEIKELRQSFQLSQTQFEAILGIGPKTVVRWENSTAVQGKALDDVLNMLKYEPRSIFLLERLRRAPTQSTRQNTPEVLRQMAELERLIYARIEATDAVTQEKVRDVTLAVMAAYEAYKEDQITSLVERYVTA